MKRIIICLSVLAALMQGCGVYQKYSNTTEVDTNLFGDEYAGADTVYFPDLTADMIQSDNQHSWHIVFSLKSQII